MKKNIILFCISLCFFFGYTQITGAADVDINSVIPYDTTVTAPGGTVLEWQGFLDYVLGFSRDVIFALLALIAIGMFLFIGARLVMARGNPEEFKKAMLSFVYAAIGIFVVAFAWAIVRLVAGIDL